MDIRSTVAVHRRDFSSPVGIGICLDHFAPCFYRCQSVKFVVRVFPVAAGSAGFANQSACRIVDSFPACAERVGDFRYEAQMIVRGCFHGTVRGGYRFQLADRIPGVCRRFSIAVGFRNEPAAFIMDIGERVSFPVRFPHDFAPGIQVPHDRIQSALHYPHAPAVAGIFPGSRIRSGTRYFRVFGRGNHSCNSACCVVGIRFCSRNRAFHDQKTFAVVGVCGCAAVPIDFRRDVSVGEIRDLHCGFVFLSDSRKPAGSVIRICITSTRRHLFFYHPSGGTQRPVGDFREGIVDRYHPVPRVKPVHARNAERENDRLRFTERRTSVFIPFGTAFAASIHGFYDF